MIDCVGERFDVVHRPSGRGTYVRRARSTALERDEHGLAGYNGGCRCASCRDTRRQYDRVNKVARAVRRGRRPAWKVPTGPVRARLVELRRSGWTWVRLVEASGCCEATLRRVLHAERCWNLTADAVLAL